MQISPKCCIVSASLPAAAFALKCRAVWFFVSWQDRLSTGGPWPPPTFAALRQRRDLIIAKPPGWGFPKGRGRNPSPFGRLKERGFLRGEGNRNPSPLKWRSLDTFFRQEKKVSRRRQKRRKKSHRADRVLRPYAYPSNAPIKATKRRTAGRRFSLHIALTAPPSPC